MQATIVHESRGRMRLRLRQKNISIRQADLLETWLKGQPWTREAVVHERTCCVIVTYTGDREAVLSALGAFTWAGAESSVTLPGHSTRTLNREFQEKLVGKVAVKAATTLFLPAPLRIARIVWHMIPIFCTEVCAAWDIVRSRWRRWMRCPSGSPSAAGTSVLPALSCFCWRSVNCWRIGLGRNLWRTWRRACPSTWTGCG